MKNLKTVIVLVINILFLVTASAQEAVTKNNNKNYSERIHSFAFEFNNALYFKGKMTEHPYLYLGYETRPSYGTEWLFKYNLTFKSGFGFSLEAVKGSCNYRFRNRNNGFTTRGETPLAYFFDMVSTSNRSGCNIKASYRYDINEWLSILPEIGIQMLYYKPFEYEYESYLLDENLDGTWTETLIQYLKYDNDAFKRKFSPDFSASFNFLFHKKDDPRHNFTVGLNANLSSGIRYFGAYSATPPFQNADCLFYLTSSYIGLRFGYSYSSFPIPIHKTKKERRKQLYTLFDLKYPAHSIGFSLRFGGTLTTNFKNIQGELIPYSNSYFYPELTLKYAYVIKKGWGITAEIPFGIFQGRFGHKLLEKYDVPWDTVWSNGVVGVGNGNDMGIRAYYVGFSLKASYLAQVHRKISLQSELGVKWQPFVRPAKWWDIDESVGEFIISDGAETEKLVYMNCMPVLSAASYTIPNLVLSFNVLVHGKNPANNFVFGIDGNISFVDRFHFKYQTTNVLPAHLQSSGEFGWRMSSIGFHIGYQWMKGKKIMVGD